jgi:hypothetical protein
VNSEDTGLLGVCASTIVAEESYAMEKVRILSSEYGAFRDDILKFFKETLLEEPSVIFDPMAGTAPLIPFIETNGHTAYLNDILPIHFWINKAKTHQAFRSYQQRGYDWYFRESLHCLSSLEGKEKYISDKWMADGILRDLVKAWHAAESHDRNSATVLKAVILSCVRPLSSTTKSKNPTWLRYGGMSSGKDLREIIRGSLTRFDEYYRHHYPMSTIARKRGKCIISMKNVPELSLPQKVDLILTSPPYCNRLDPMVQYGPENYFLAALGYTIPEESLVSTTKVRDYDRLALDFKSLTAKSENACRLLTKIRESPIADDPGYYLKYYTRYFAKLSRVISKALSYLSKTGRMYIVTQDNTHRGELIEIDKVLSDLLKAERWRSMVIETWERHHQGLQNVSRNHAFVRPKQLEKLMVVWR